MESFIQDPSESLLEQCTREQLLKIAERYKIDISDKKLKESVTTYLKDDLFEAGVLCRQPVGSPVTNMMPTTLTFGQQKELLQLQLK